MFAARGLMTIILTLLISLFASCSGSAPAPTTTPDSLTQTPEFSMGLPGAPGGPEELRDATMVTGAFQMGTEYIWRHNAPEDGTDLHLIAPEGPGDYTAWAYYAFPDTGTQPSTLTVNAMWLDPDLQGTSPDEGYWIGISDYDKGVWHFLGPVTMSQVRFPIPEWANVVSPGGFIYAIVLTHSGDEAVLHSIQIGYDAGVGYEEHWLAAPQGMFTGQESDIQLLNDNPQIAYISQRGLSDRGGTAKIAALLVGEWHTEAIDTPFNVNCVQFALGDGGRRAVLLDTRDISPQELWLFYDDGSGAFDAGQLISNTFDNNCAPAVTFVNGADDPTGELDLVLMVYADQGVAWQDMHTYYRTYDGALLSPQLDLYGGDTTDTEILALSTDSDLAGLCGVGNIAGGWRYYVGTFSALALPPAWNFGAVTSWICPTSVPSEPDFVLRELPSGDYVAGYYTYDSTVVLGRWDGVAWNHEPRDIHSVFLGEENQLDMEAYSDGDVGLPGSYGMFNPVLHVGQVGIGSTDWDDFYLGSGAFGYMRPSLAVGSDDMSHIAYCDTSTFSLGYMTRATDGTVATEIVDNGAMAEGMNGPYVSATVVDSALYVFSTDDAHMRMLYSVNYNGMWARENVAIPTDGSYPFYIVGSGYLENEDLVYVAWWDWIDLSVYIASAHPLQDDWEVVQFTGQTFEFWPTVADDESGIGIAHLVFSEALGDAFFAFGHGPARTPHAPWEIITASGDYTLVPWRLAYNPVADEWGFLATGDNRHRVNYFRRVAPGVWQGPSTVLYREGIGGEAYAFGLTFREGDGAAQALVVQRLSGTSVYYLTVFSAPSGTSDWGFVNTFASVDTTVGELDQFIGCTPDENGEIVAYMPHKLIADPYWDIEIFTTDGTDNWASIGLWDDAYSEIVDPDGAESVFAGAVTDSGPAAFIVEADDAMPTFGRVGAYYPW